jgi:hypothetical protein
LPRIGLARGAGQAPDSPVEGLATRRGDACGPDLSEPPLGSRSPRAASSHPQRVRRPSRQGAAEDLGQPGGERKPTCSLSAVTCVVGAWLHAACGQGIPPLQEAEVRRRHVAVLSEEERARLHVIRRSPRSKLPTSPISSTVPFRYRRAGSQAGITRDASATVERLGRVSPPEMLNLDGTEGFDLDDGA